MKDFLNDLGDQEEIRKNPFKAFAAYTALKFEDNDKKCKEITDKVDIIEKATEKKLNEKEFNAFLRDYDRFKERMTVYVILGTAIINGIIWLIVEFFKG